MPVATPHQTAEGVSGCSRRPVWRRLLLFVCAGLLFIPFLGRRDIVTSHEGRVAQTARLMREAGPPWSAAPVEVSQLGLERVGNAVRIEPRHDLPPLRVNPWLVPTLGGELRLQKPPLPYWTAAALYGPMEIGPAAARLTPALLGTLTALLVYELAHLLTGRATAWIAPAVWLSSYFVVEEYRKAMSDPYLGFFTLLCVWAWISASTRKAVFARRVTSVRKSRSGIRTALAITFYASLALGVLSKGPFVFLHVGLAITSFHLCHRRPLPWRTWQHLLGFAVLFAVVLPWPLYVLRTVPRAGELWCHESGAGLVDDLPNRRPWWFYLAALPQITLPWTPAFLVAFALPFTRLVRTSRARLDTPTRLSWWRRRRRSTFPMLWLMSTVLVFSLSTAKKQAYLLPAAPAAILMTANVLREAQRAWRRASCRAWPLAIMRIQGAIGIGLAVCVLGFIVADPLHRNGELILAGALLVLASGSALAVARAPSHRLAVTAATCTASLFLGCNFPFTDYENARSAKEFAARAGPLLSAANANVLTYRISPEVAFYLPTDLRYRPAARDNALLIVDDRQGASARGIEYLQSRVDGRILSAERLIPPAAEGAGRERWKLFRLHLADERTTVSSDGGP